ncbi:MAG: hypothetical protein JSV78_14380 [Phycisphaerales bacterium]|nr:MAG: hypothetical protein JSV78_14380 [Phycisphaerales bacterium]
MSAEERYGGSKKCPECGETLARLDSGRCPECGFDLSTEIPRRRYPRFLSLPPMRYPSAYVWLVFASALDVILTYLVLYYWEGFEANPIAAAVIAQKGFVWAIAFKFALVVLSILVCEVVGRLRDRDGKRLAVLCVVIAALPVVYTLTLLSWVPPPAVG